MSAIPRAPLTKPHELVRGQVEPTVVPLSQLGAANGVDSGR